MDTHLLNGERIRAIPEGWFPDGKWMIVWDHHVSANSVCLRKVYAILPSGLDVMFPVYAKARSGYSHCCWKFAAEIPEGMDISNLVGYTAMMEDLNNE